jgi:hypothetical protein
VRSGGWGRGSKENPAGGDDQRGKGVHAVTPRGTQPARPYDDSGLGQPWLPWRSATGRQGAQQEKPRQTQVARRGEFERGKQVIAGMLRTRQGNASAARGRCHCGPRHPATGRTCSGRKSPAQSLGDQGGLVIGYVNNDACINAGTAIVARFVGGVTRLLGTLRPCGSVRLFRTELVMAALPGTRAGLGRGRQATDR